MRTENMKYSYILLLLIAALFWGGCTKESRFGEEKPLPEGSVRIMLANSNGTQSQTKAGAVSPVSNDATSENYVKKIQVFFYSEGKLEYIRQYLKGGTDDEIVWTGASEMIVNRVSNLGKPKDVYVVTNWMADLPAAITIGSTLNVLQEQLTALTTGKLPFTPSENTPLLMSGGVNDYKFHEQGQSGAKTATITLNRQMVKIDVKILFNKQFYDVISSNHTFSNAILSVCNMPSQSFVMEQSPVSLPTGSTMFELPNQNIVNVSNTWSYTLYCYENPQAGTGMDSKVKSTYFDLNVPYTKTIAGASNRHDNHYRVYIEDVTNEAKDSPHKTLRNHHYTVTVTIIGFGTEESEFDAIHAATTVAPWNIEEIEQEVSGKNMTINKTEVVLSDNVKNKTLIARGTTNIDPLLVADPSKLFSAPIYPIDMTESQKGIELGYELRDEKSIIITIQNTSSEFYDGNGVTTFYVQYGLFKKKISVAYYIKPDFEIIGYFGGNPEISGMLGEGTMYPKQLALSFAEGSASFRTIDLDNNDASIINSIYYGRDMNIAAEKLLNRADYPAFSFCASLNKDLNSNGYIDDVEMVWYLPSQSQMLAMYVFNKGLEYTSFLSGTFWCATEYDRFNIWRLILPDCAMNGSSRLSTYNVRCVRDI